MSGDLRSRIAMLLRPDGPVRRYGPLAILGLVAAALLAFVVEQPPSGLPLDPRSPDASGTKALALVLERVGADVRILDTPDDPAVDSLLVLVDNLDTPAAAEVEAFAEAGGTVLVADYSGLLGAELRPAGAASTGMLAPTLPRACDIPALDGIERIRPGSSPLFVVPDGATGCFGEDEAAWLVVRDVGTGTIATTGGSSFLTNSLIGEHDNAALAAAVLAPQPGSRVGILEPQFAPEGGAGTRSLGDLIPDRLFAVGVQLLIAFLVVVFWRARRLGKPVREPQAVRLAGSELVVAMGTLMQRTGARERAVEWLRFDVRQTLSQHLGVPADLPADDMAAIAAQRTAVPRADILQALSSPIPDHDAGLVELAQLAESIRTSLRVPKPLPAGA